MSPGLVLLLSLAFPAHASVPPARLSTLSVLQDFKNDKTPDWWPVALTLAYEGCSKAENYDAAQLERTRQGLYRLLSDPRLEDVPDRELVTRLKNVYDTLRPLADAMEVRHFPLPPQPSPMLKELAQRVSRMDPGSFFDGSARKRDLAFPTVLKSSSQPRPLPVSNLPARALKAPLPPDGEEPPALSKFPSVVRAPFNVLGITIGSVYEAGRGLVTGVYDGIAGLVSGRPGDLLVKPLKAAANSTYSLVTLPLPLASAALDPLTTGMGLTDPTYAEFRKHEGHHHLVIAGGLLPQLIPRADAYVLNEHTVVAKHPIEREITRHEFAHTKQFHDSFVFDFQVDYLQENAEKGYWEISYEKEGRLASDLGLGDLDRYRARKKELIAELRPVVRATLDQRVGRVPHHGLFYYEEGALSQDRAGEARLLYAEASRDRNRLKWDAAAFRRTGRYVDLTGPIARAEALMEIAREIVHKETGKDPDDLPLYGGDFSRFPSPRTSK